MTHSPEMRMDTIEWARHHGMQNASRKFGVSVSTVKNWVDDVEAPIDQQIGAVPAIVETVVVGGDAQIEGLPAGGTVAYVDPTNIVRHQQLAALYSNRRRAELRVKLADAAVKVVEKIIETQDARDADYWGRTLTAVSTLMRLEGGQVSSLKGVVDVRAELDKEQAVAPRGPDLTKAIEAKVSDEMVDEAL